MGHINPASIKQSHLDEVHIVFIDLLASLVIFDLYHVSESVRKGGCTEARGGPAAGRFARTNILTNETLSGQNGSYGN